MSILDELEKKIQEIIDRQFGRSASHQPLEIRRMLLKEIEAKVQPVGGKRVFPFNCLTVYILAKDQESRAIYTVTFVQNNQLQRDVLQLLEETRCAYPPALDVEVRLVGGDSDDYARVYDRGFLVEYELREQPVESIQPQPEARLTVLRGSATQESYSVKSLEINIGRMPEVADPSGRVFRRNDVAFWDVEDEINPTVSRAHAHIRFEEGGAEFRLIDDGSARGTRIVREGRTIEVPSGDHRGVRLQDGDEIYLGQACLKFKQD